MRFSWSGAQLKGAVLACLWASTCGVSWSATGENDDSPRIGSDLVLLEFSSNPPSAVFESEGHMFVLRAGESYAPLQLSLAAVDRSGVTVEFRLTSGQRLSLRMQRDDELWPEQLRSEFEQSLISPYHSAEPGQGLGHERP